MLDLSNVKNSEKFIFTLSKLNSNNNLYYFLGIITFFIYSKEIFPRNKDLIEFTEEIFKISFPKYIMRSRTLIVAKISKIIIMMEEKEILIAEKKMLKYFNQEDESFTKNSKKKNENEKLDIWLKNL